MKQTYFICFLVILLLSLSSNAQTYISPVIGYDFTNIDTDDTKIGYVYTIDVPFGINSMVFGIKLKQHINDKLYFSLQSNFSKKFATAWTFNFLPFDGIKFNYFQNSMALNYKYKKYFCSLGGNYNVLTKLNLTVNKKKINLFYNDLNEQGIRFSIGRMLFNNFNIEAYFYKGFTSNFDNETIFLKPIESIGVLFSYDIKCFDKIRRKIKANCPKF